MNRTTENGRPAYCDERAHKFFSWVYTGQGEVRGHCWSFDTTHKDLEPPAAHVVGTFWPICAHCGARAYPVQCDRGNNYGTRGYTCVCKGAMDEREWRQQWTALKTRHEEEEVALKKLQPVLPREFVDQAFEMRLQQIRDNFQRHQHLSTSEATSLQIDFGVIEEEV